MNNRPVLRFDAREIAVLFSLFIFVSLLMFTVGFLVGKGLTQARYEGKLGVTPALEPVMKSNEAHPGASVSLGSSTHPTEAEAKAEEAKAEPEQGPKEKRKKRNCGKRNCCKRARAAALEADTLKTPAT